MVTWQNPTPEGLGTIHSYEQCIRDLRCLWKGYCSCGVLLQAANCVWIHKVGPLKILDRICNLITCLWMMLSERGGWQPLASYPRCVTLASLHKNFNNDCLTDGRTHGTVPGLQSPVLHRNGLLVHLPTGQKCKIRKAVSSKALRSVRIVLCLLCV